MTKPELAYVPISTIRVDEAYQRPLDQKRIERLRRAFDRGASKAISVSRRPNGSLYVYDGQHTLELCRAMGLESIAAVIVDGDQQKEARWFLLMNGAGVSKARARETHVAAIVADDPVAKEVQDLMDTYGILLAKGGSKAGTMSAIGTMRTWVKADKERLVRAMDVIDRLWCTEDHAWTQVVMRGAWDIAADHELLVQVETGLAKHKVTPRRILDTAHGMQEATGTPGGGSGYSKAAYLKLAKVKPAK